MPMKLNIFFSEENDEQLDVWNQVEMYLKKKRIFYNDEEKSNDRDFEH